MELWQQFIIILYGIIAFIAFISSFNACHRQKKSFEDTPVWSIFFTGFVQADNVVFGLFWTAIAILTLLLNDWLLFLLTLSLFWLVRSLGETIYWFFHQFIPRGGNDPQKFWHYRFFHNDSVLFVNQIYWQCITVITSVSSIYLAHLWLKSLN